MSESEKPSDLELDHALQQYRVSPGSEELKAKILDAAPRTDTRPTLAIALNDWLQAAGGWQLVVPRLALALILGIGLNIGLSLTPHLITDTSEITAGASIWDLAMLSSEAPHDE